MPEGLNGSVRGRKREGLSHKDADACNSLPETERKSVKALKNEAAVRKHSPDSNKLNLDVSAERLLETSSELNAIRIGALVEFVGHWHLFRVVLGKQTDLNK